MRNYLEIWFWQIARRIIIKGYGADCETRDLDDFEDEWTKEIKEALELDGRCPSCKAKEIVSWIDGHIELLKFYA